MTLKNLRFCGMLALEEGGIDGLDAGDIALNHRLSDFSILV